jgi:hypothetical protein
MEDQVQLKPGIPDLPAGLAEPPSPPSMAWIAVRPDVFGLPPLAVAGVYLADGLLVFGAVLALRRATRGGSPRLRPPALPPPRDQALTALAQIRAAAPTTSGRETALQLSAIIRRFTEREYGVVLTTQTQEEFADLLRQYPDALPERLSHDLLSFLEACDHAKFKSGSDSEGIKTQLWEAADALLRNAPAPEPVKSAPAA